jgi:hypothetical protein
MTGVDLVAASRADFPHKTGTRLVRDHDLIVIEDLDTAKNILAAGHAVTACGGDVRHPEPPLGCGRRRNRNPSP